jgi:hypothetical protein
MHTGLLLLMIASAVPIFSNAVFSSFSFVLINETLQLTRR